MIIYKESKTGFINDVDNNVIKERLVDAFRSKTGSVPSDQNVWAEEYSRFANALRQAKVDNDIQVAIEYHISAAGRFRVDVLLAGNDGRTDNGMIIELKAWETAEVSDIPDLVISPLRGRPPKDHPCLQARKYKGLIVRFNQDIREQAISLCSAAYLFNLKRRNPEPLEDARYQHILKDSKLFLANDASKLTQFIEEVVPQKPKKDVLFIIENGRLLPSNELIGRVSSMLDGNEEFELIDEQNEAFQIIRHQVTSQKNLTHRHVFVVEGGPGTGKSVIAVRLLAEILKAKRMGFFVAPNKAFRDTLIEFLARGNRGYREDGQALIQSSWSFHQVDYEKDARNEVLIVDEAHRLKDKAYQYYGKSMVEDMVRASRISVFFIDETQRVSWNDSGSIKAIKEAAFKFGAKFHEPPFNLLTQYRCNGSVGYMNWLDDVLQIRPTANFDNWGTGQYEFKVFDRAEDLYGALKIKNDANKARLIAGYSWAWPTEGRERGTSVNHVQADGLSLPWNYNGENWATSEDGIEQVGCVHTSQGVEFDWLGVLIGADLTFQDGAVIGVPGKRAKTDKSLNGWKKALREARGDLREKQVVLDKVQAIITSTYKVLLSRGRKGCYVWCADAGLREYLKQRLALVSSTATKIIPLKLPIIQDPGARKYIDFAPVCTFEIAAGSYGKLDSGDLIGWMEVPKNVKIGRQHFVAKVVGKSMEPLIKDGTFCLFRLGVEGSRMGKIVLAQLATTTDPETHARFTVKKYRSAKAASEEHAWEHTHIQLMPINAAFSPIEISSDNSEDVKILAEFIMTLS